MIKVNLADGSFNHALSCSLGGECERENPKFITWDRSASSPGPVFITDMAIKDVEKYANFPARIGLLLEPPSLSDGHYRNAVLLQEHFDVILTFDTALIAAYPNKFLYYPYGGSWIHEKDWNVYPKFKMISMIASQKTGAVGHRLRHAIVERFSQYAPNMGVDVMGLGYRPIPSKLEGLKDYRYSIVVESCRHEQYFSEKLIDSLSCGTIPIYWGCEAIGDFFNRNGIISFTTLTELEHILVNVISNPDYSLRKLAIQDNFERARQYRSSEDWLYNCYPELFEGCVSANFD